MIVWKTHDICNSASVSREPVSSDEGHGIGEGKRTTGRHKVPICQHSLHTTQSHSSTYILVDKEICRPGNVDQIRKCSRSRLPEYYCVTSKAVQRNCTSIVDIESCTSQVCQDSRVMKLLADMDQLSLQE